MSWKDGLIGEVLDVGLAPIDLVFEGLEKTYDELNDSTLGQAVMLGAAIYFGGLALQANWGTGLLAEEMAGSELAAESLAGEAVTGSAAELTAMEEAAGAGELLGAPVDAATAAATTTDTSAALAAGGDVAPTANLAAAPSAPSPAAGVAELPGSPVGVSELPGGLNVNLNPTMTSGATGAGTGASATPWYQQGLVPYGLIQAGAGLIQGAMAPDQIDIMQEQAALQQQAEAERIARKNRNAAVGNINLGRPARSSGIGIYGSIKPLPYTPTGLIQGAVNT